MEQDAWALSAGCENPFYSFLQMSTQEMWWHSMFVSMNQLPTWLARLQKAAWCSLTSSQEERAKLQDATASNLLCHVSIWELARVFIKCIYFLPTLKSKQSGTSEWESSLENFGGEKQPCTDPMWNLNVKSEVIRESRLASYVRPGLYALFNCI